MQQPIEQIYPTIQTQDAHDPLLEKKVWHRDLSPEQLKEQVEKNAAYFANFIINELKEIAQQDGQPLIYNIIIKNKTDKVLKNRLRSALGALQANIPENITISINDKPINLVKTLKPVINSNTGTNNSDIAEKRIPLVDLFDTYSTKKTDDDFEIIALTLEQQIDALLSNSLSEIARTELAAWQATLKDLLKNAAGKSNEIQQTKQIEMYIEKTQAIVRLLNQPLETPKEQQDALLLAIGEFNQTIKALSENDQAFEKALKWSVGVTVAIITIVLIGGLIAINPFIAVLFLPIALLAAVLSSNLAAEKHANQQIYRADESSFVSKALSKLGIFYYIPYKHTGLEFSKQVIKQDANHPSSRPSAETPKELLTPVYTPTSTNT